MLDTVLQIGRAFRKSKDGMKYHRYIKKPYPDERKNKKGEVKMLYLSLPVRKDFTFDFDGIKEISDENLIEDLYYLKFKTSDSDRYTTFFYGDIYWETPKTKKEKDLMGSAFKRGKRLSKNIKSPRVKGFVQSFDQNQKQIEEVLAQHPRVFLHFDFQDGNPHWYSDDEVDQISALMIENFVTEVAHGGIQGVVLDKMLYRTLCSGDLKNDIQFPSFRDSEKYKSKLFTLEDLRDLFYAIDYSSKGLFPIQSTKIKVIVLPKGNNLSGDDYQRFSEEKTSLKNISSKEDEIRTKNKEDSLDTLFAPLEREAIEKIIEFDLILCKQGRASSPDVDLIEIAGLSKSLLSQIAKRIQQIRLSLEDRWKQTIPTDKDPLDIIRSFLNILGDPTKDKKKYQSHLLKVLPKIYTATYYFDPLLLPALIEKTEANLRDPKNQKSGFYFLKWDFEFLTRIQNTEMEGKNLMDIQNSESYKTGLLLGRLAYNLKYAIKSFEKSYVGNLTRRIATLGDLVKFKTYIEEKIIIHEKSYPRVREDSLELSEKVKNFNETYDKNECAFGFFESYFASHPQKQAEGQESETKESN